MKLIQAVLFAVLSLFLASIAAATPKELKVGVILPLSGPGAVFGEAARNALSLASEEINNEGAVKVKLLVEDSKTEGRLGVSAYHRLTAVEKVDAVVGDLWDFTVIPLIPLSASSKTLTISPLMMDFSPEHISKSDYFWTLGSKVGSLRAPLERFLDLHPEQKRIGIFCWENPWGLAHLEMWREVARARGREVVIEACDGDFASDLRAVTRRMVAQKSELMIAATIISTFAKRVSELKSTAPVLTTSDIRDSLRDSAFDKKLLEGYYFTDWKEPEEFSKRYHKRFGTPPVHEASKSYYALISIRDAALAKREGESLSDAIRRVVVKKEDGTTIDFSKRPYPNESPATLFKVVSGEAVEQM
jgi:branched-chain amino acid transport system substrate-binding protein